MNRGKIAVLGDAGVGKSSLIIQLRNDCFPDNPPPTIEDTCYHTINSTLIEIVDTGGAACYQSLRPRWIKESDMILVVFNNSLPNSLYEAEEILKNERGSRPAILVRNKVHPRSKEDLSAKDLAGKHGCAYFELWAKDREQVKKVFAVATRLIEKRTTISSDPDAAANFELNRICVTTTLEQEVEHMGVRNLIGRCLRLRKHRHRRRACR